MKRNPVTPGVLPVIKPAGPTSRDVVNRVMRVLGTRRVGHAGTLDPFAEGLVLVAWDRATGLVPYLQEYPKTYEAVAELGLSTDTQDHTGTILRRTDTGGITREAIASELEGFRGTILQVPPMYSALKQGGKRLHELAREGVSVVREPRERQVHDLVLLGWEPPILEFRVTCSAGTYVRTLAHDLGEGLGVGAALGRLVRTAVGPHGIERAVPLADLETLDAPALLGRALTPAEALPDWPALVLEEPGEVREVRCGSWRDPRGRLAPGVRSRILDGTGTLVALVEGGSPPRYLRVLGGEGGAS